MQENRTEPQIRQTVQSLPQLHEIFGDFSSNRTTYGNGLPAWQPSAPLSGHQKFDAVVVGGGLTGLTAALELSRQGKKVLLLEAKTIGEGPSGRSGGQIIPGFETPMNELAEEFGLEKAAAIWGDVEAARHRMHERIDAAPDKCDSQNGVIAAAMSTEQLEEAKDNAYTLRKHFNFMAVKVLDREEIKKHINSPDYVGGLMYTDGRHINPEKYIRHLAKLAQEAGVVIAENSPVEKFSRNQEVGFTIETPAGSAAAENVVIACGAKFHRPEGLDFKTLGRRFVPVQTVILATEPLSDEAMKRAIPGEASWYDLRQTMNYVRRTPDNRILFGGANIMTDLLTSVSTRALVSEMYKTLPSLQDDGVRVESFWSGHVDMSKTMLPGVRRLEPGLYEASGFSGHGMALTGLAGEAIAEDIVTNGASERLARLSSIAAQDFNKNALVAKAQLAQEWLGSAISDSLSTRRGAGEAAEAAPEERKRRRLHSGAIALGTVAA